MKILSVAMVGLVSVGMLFGFQGTGKLDVGVAYRSAHAAGDRAAMAELWKEHPDRILGTFDADLEGGLAVWEQGEEGHGAKTAELFARALWGAQVASEATGRRIFGDYAGSFVSWTDEQRRSFRAGQAAFGASRKAQGAGDWEEALEQGRDCRVRAMALGDWWGAAMGYMGEGVSLHKLGRHEEAAAALGLARLINQDLGLVGSELGAAVQLAKCLVEMDAGPRAAAAVDAALGLARRLGQEEAEDELKRMQAELAK